MLLTLACPAPWHVPASPQVGRTGSGKSTLLLALFRLLRIEAGIITLDGIDTSKVGACCFLVMRLVGCCMRV